MFNFSELREMHLEISNNCQASCPMCARTINGGPDNPLLTLNDWSLNDFKSIMSEQVLKQLDGFYFCGNFGDPILNKDLLEMCRYSTEINSNLNIRIHTNGSAKSTEWWSNLAKALPKVHNLVFALDGLADTHHIYRVGTNFNTILKNARAFIDAGGIAEWCYIRFKHNEHQVEEARQMAKDYGFNSFVLKNSSRFILEPKFKVIDKEGNTKYHLEPASDTPMKFIDKKAIANYKEIVKQADIKCMAKEQREVYIDAHYSVFPCCWLSTLPYTYRDMDEMYLVGQEMVSQYHDLVSSLGGLDNLNAIKKPLNEIIDSYEYQTVWDTYWNEKKLIKCVRMCGVSKSMDYSQPKHQRTEVTKYD